MKLNYYVILCLQVCVLLFANPSWGKSNQQLEIQAVLDEAYLKFKGQNPGKNADYIPALAKVDSKLFGLALVTTDGKIYTKGDVNQAFSIQSISKVFTLSLAIEQQGSQDIFDKIGVNATGLPFNSVIAIELNKDRSINPLVNAGAMAAVSLLAGKDKKTKWS